MRKHLPFIIIMIIITVIGTLLISFMQPAPAADQRKVERVPSSISASETAYDFGRISMAQGVVKHSFKIQNTTQNPISIEKIYTSCMCTTAELNSGGNSFGPFGMPGHGAIPRIDALLQPSESADVEVAFDPAAHGPAGVGAISRQVYVENNPDQVLVLSFNAFVTP